MKTRHKRIALIVGGLAILGAVVALVLNAFQSNLVFFFSPTQVAAGEAPKGKPFRIGGMVKEYQVVLDPVRASGRLFWSVGYVLVLMAVLAVFRLSAERAALTLVALGFRALSLTPSALGAVKAMLLELDAKKAEETLRPLIEHPPKDVSIRKKLEEFAAAEGLPL